MHLTQLFDLSLHGRAESPGLIYDDVSGATRTLTFGEVDARANRMANELVARRLTKGDRLCLHVANRVEYIDLYLACIRLGVILVPMNVLYREREVRHIVGDAEPVAVVASVAPGPSTTDRHGHRQTDTEQQSVILSPSVADAPSRAGSAADLLYPP